MKPGYKLLHGLIFLSAFFTVHGQQNDFQAWPSLNANLEVFDNFTFHIEEEIRFHENLSLVDQQINDFGISYRFNKYFKTGLYYRIEADWKNAEEYSWRKGFYGDISFRHKIDRFTLTYRIRLQSFRVERSEKEIEVRNGFRHRHKLSAEYNVKGIPLVPFVDVELFTDYTRRQQSMIKGVRTWIGMDYSINKIHTLTLKYGIDKEINTVDPLNAYIIALGYAIDIR